MSETVMEEASQEKPDFSNYTWFPGVKEKYNAVSVSTHEGRIFLGIKGFDKKSSGHGYIQAEFSPEVLVELQGRIGDAIAGESSA